MCTSMNEEKNLYQWYWMADSVCVEYRVIRREPDTVCIRFSLLCVLLNVNMPTGVGGV